MSRRHARLELLPEGVLLEDLASHNGVFHLGQRVGRMVLSSDSRIFLGSVELRVAIDVEALGDELPLFPGESYRGMVGRSVAMRRLFASLERLEGSLVTVLTYTNAPPIPGRVTDASGATLVDRQGILHGQEVFLKYGLMEHGTLWGHGAYLGPDYTAEYLHRHGPAAAQVTA